MAPMKRKSTEDDSNLRQDSRKKSRPSYDVSQRDDSQELTDEEMDEDVDEEVFEEEATQFLTQQKRKNNTHNEPADNGILESVTCQNFMCHSYLEIALGPLINFIIGHNGSGKSAVLTAITICLGGKATATNRGQSLKSFIKEGQESSIVTVKIKNTADSAYQHEVYGDTIIVERHFTRSGSSTFRLKSCTGRLISNRKGDLEDICDYFALQIDNPMNVLTQDMARQFLNNSTPSDKYKFFMKGTQLEHLDGDYVQIEQNMDKIDQDLFRNLKDVEIYEEEANKAKALLSLSEKHDTLRQKIRAYGYQMAWAQVEEQERYVTACDDDLRKADETIQAAQRKALEASDTFENADRVLENAKAVVVGLQEALVPVQDEKDLVKQEHEKFKGEAMSAQAEQRQIKVVLKAAKNRVTKTESEIEEEHRRLDDANGGSHTTRLAELERKKADVTNARDRLAQHENSIGQLESEKHRADKEYSETQGPIISKRESVQQCEERLNTLVRDRGQQQGAYKPSMPRLLNAIRQDDGFIEKPVGPLGNHVQLLKPLWSSILEKSFGGALETFIVTSKQDHSRLSTLMQKIGCFCPILIGNNSPIDTSNHEPHSSFDTVLRALKIDNDLVRKQLIINQAIEQTVLTEDRDDGVNALEGPNSRNVKQCYTLTVRHGAGLRLTHGYGGGLSQSFLEPFKGLPRMKTDIEYQINSQRETLGLLKSELNELERIRRDKQASLKACEQAIVRHRRESNNLMIAVQSAKSVVEELQDALDRDVIEEGRLDVLKEHLAEATDEVGAHEGSYEDSVVAIDKIKELMKTSRDQMAVLDARIAEAEAQINKAENKATRVSTQRDGALRLKNSAYESIDKAVTYKASVEKDRAEKAGVVAQFTEQANNICARVPVDAGETGDSLDKKLKKLSADLKKYEDKLGGDKRKIAENAAQAVETYNQAKEEVENIERLAQLLKYTLLNRRSRWRHFQRCITARARLQFFYLLSERGFRGRLIANHKERKLDLNVEPDETKSGKGHDTKTLSGGEKSFSTICLLLSLWDAMGAPIRCLDEFDVFMDSVNREVSMRLMIAAARRSVGKQFVLITPQAMGRLDSDHDVKIVKMSDPERGQTTLSFPPA